MAAPAEVTSQNLSGKWSLNRSLSDSTEAGLELQGISWITRKTLAKAPITISITQYTDEKGLMHFDTEQKILGKTVEQKNSVDGTPVKIDHPLFGNIAVSHTWAAVESIGEAYLKEALEAGTTNVLELKIENLEDGWKSTQIATVETIDGERHHVRRSVVTKGDKVAKTRLVYNYEGKN